MRFAVYKVIIGMVEEIAMKEIEEYMEKFPAEIINMFKRIRQIIFDSIACEPEEVLWAKLPSYCVGKSFVRLIPLCDC